MSLTALPTDAPAPDAGPDPLQTVRRARRGPRRRHLLVVAALSAAFLAAFAARVLLGDYTITIPDFFRILSGADIPGATYILMESKLPRAVLGAMVGLSLGLGGAIFQTTLRNPLASPDVIGISAGASAAAVFGIVILGVSGLPLMGLAVLGAVATALTVRLVAGEIGGFRLVLVGVALGAAALSVVQYLFTRADEFDAQLVLVWLTGSLNQITWSDARLLAVALVVLLPLIAWQSQAQRIAELGPETAAGLGVSRWATERLLLLAVLLVGVGVAVTGPISFVAFLAGPIARALNAGRSTLLGSAIVGALIVVAADYVAAYLISGVNFPVGVITGACGAPFLLWLLVRSTPGRSHG